MQIERLEDFIANMPKSLSTNTEKARWLYIELGKRSFYDVSYGFLNEDEEQELMYDHKNYKNPNIITCTSLTDQYEKLLKIIGIESKVITDGGHRYLRFYEEDGITWHTADLTNDLKNVQSGCQTSHFLQIDSEKLRDIDKRIGYISEKKGYTDDYFEQVKDFIIKKGLKGKAQLEYILEVFHLYVRPEKMAKTKSGTYRLNQTKLSLFENSLNVREFNKSIEISSMDSLLSKFSNYYDDEKYINNMLAENFFS